MHLRLSVCSTQPCGPRAPTAAITAGYDNGGGAEPSRRGVQPRVHPLGLALPGAGAIRFRTRRRPFVVRIFTAMLPSLASRHNDVWSWLLRARSAQSADCNKN